VSLTKTNKRRKTKTYSRVQYTLELKCSWY